MTRGKTLPRLGIDFLFKDTLILITLRCSYADRHALVLLFFVVQLFILTIVHATVLEITRASCLCWLKFCIIRYAQLNSKDSSVAY